MPEIQKRFPSTKPVKRKSRQRTYVLISIILVIIVVGVAVYVSQLSNSTTRGDFALSAPPGITIWTNATTTSTISVNGTNGFNQVVKLSAVVPNNVTATFNPQNITGTGTSKLTMSATFPGTYSITITGTSGLLTHSVSPVVATPVYANISVTSGTITGTIEVELFRAETPMTVTNFVNLAQSNFYNNLTWHRISSTTHVIQTGDPYSRNGGGNRTYSPTGECCFWGTGGSSQKVPQELGATKVYHNVAGTLGMARGSDVNSATSQFYVNTADNRPLDTVNQGYAVFGRVVKDPANLVQAISNHAVNLSSPYEQDHEIPLDPLPYVITVTISYSP